MTVALLLRVYSFEYLQVGAQAVDFVQHEIDVLFLDGSRRDDGSEEVGPTVVGLVADHQCARHHHAGFDDWADLEEDFYEIRPLKIKFSEFIPLPTPFLSPGCVGLHEVGSGCTRTRR